MDYQFSLASLWLLIALSACTQPDRNLDASFVGEQPLEGVVRYTFP